MIIILTKFEVDMIVRCQVMTLLLLIRHVTLWPWPFTFWPEQWLYVAGHVVNLSTKFEDSIRSSFLSCDDCHIRHHWECVCSHWACAASRDAFGLRGKFSPRMWNPCPRFVYSFCNFYGSTIKINPVIRQKSVLLCVTGAWWLFDYCLELPRSF